MNYYYANSRNEPIGPVSIDSLRALADRREINAQTPVVPEGGSEWKTYGEIAGVAAQPRTPQATSPISGGGFNWVDFLVGLVLACLSGFVLPWVVVRSAAKELSGWGKNRSLPSSESDLPVLTNVAVITRAYCIILIIPAGIIGGVIAAFLCEGAQIPALAALAIGLLVAYIGPVIVSFFFESMGLLVRIANETKNLRRLP